MMIVGAMMMTLTRLGGLTGLAILLTAGLARAAEVQQAALEEKPQFARIAYDAHWGGFQIAEVTFALDTKPGTYNSDMQIQPVGILHAFTDFTADLNSHGSFQPGGKTVPANFHRTWSSGEDSGDVTIDYNQETGIALGMEDGKPDDRIEEALRRNVVDPLAVMIAMRHALLMGEKENLTFQIYDGKRRFDLKGYVGEPRTYEMEDRSYEVIPMKMKFTPLAGFNGRQRKGWQDAGFNAMFSTDGRALPLQITLETMLGGLVLNLKGSCAVAGGDCQLPEPVEQ